MKHLDLTNKIINEQIFFSFDLKKINCLFEYQPVLFSKKQVIDFYILSSFWA